MKNKTMPPELASEALYRVCDPKNFTFHITDETPYTSEIIGQQRAVEAIHFGLDIQSPGFNIFVMGPIGTGRRSLLHRTVAEQAAAEKTPHDWVYVNHFTDPRRPRAISLPPGLGTQFRMDMERFNNGLTERLQLAFETDQYAEEREQLEQQYRSTEQDELGVIDQACRDHGFALVRSPSGLYITPVHNGELLTPEVFSQLKPKEQDRLEKDLDNLEEMLSSAMRRMRELERNTQIGVEQLDRAVADYTITPFLQDLKTRYADQPKVLEYLDAVRWDIVENIRAFLEDDEKRPESLDNSLLEVPFAQRYRVNLLVDNSPTNGAPLIVEENPSYEKIFGHVEYDVRYGVTSTDYTLIRPGALQRANGGYLIIDAASLLNKPLVWAGLKNALFHSVINIAPPDGQRMVRTVTPIPEPIPLKVKIILQGLPYIYYALHAYDEDFDKLFKVRADFRAEMQRTPDSEKTYVQFVRSMCQDENLLPLTPKAVARIVEFGSRLAEHQDRLSTRFGKIADLVREASYWAHKAEQPAIRRNDVTKALAKQRQRANYSEERTHQAIKENQLIVETAGKTTGQINALTVITLGDYSYGLPCRITARAYVGHGSVVDIQREIKMSGPIHGKGVLNLVGYFGGQYGTTQPLAMEASLSFEQLYEGIDGDSASAAELYALISALADIPLRQDLAVTGAVDQYGHILPIGGVNEKIEGFFAICKMRGLSGTQGVVIPKANTISLMLNENVVKAVQVGDFHIYPVATIDEALTLLTGRPAGTRDKQGDFPAASVHSAVEIQLRKFAQLAQNHENPADEES